MNKPIVSIFLTSHFFNDIFELGIVHFIFYLAGLIATYFYRHWLFSKIRQIWNIIEKLLGKNSLKQYKIDDLIFEYYPIFNDWKASITILSNNDVEVVKVIPDEFPLDPIFSHRKKTKKSIFQNSDRVRLNNYKITLNGKLKVTFQKTKYLNYLDSNEHLEELYYKQNRTFRDVLLTEIEKGDIEDFPLTNICGAGMFSITKDNKLIISKHSGNSKVYPNMYTFTASGVLNWVESKTNANPFRGISEIYTKKIGYDINENEIKMIGFGADARKLYFQFSFFENSPLHSEDLKRLQISKNIFLPEEQKRELFSIPFKLDQVVESLFTKIWEPAAEVALLTYCVKEFGRKDVLKTLKKWESCWEERNTRNEFEYRCASREDYSADLTTSIPKKELDQISNKNIEQVLAFIGKEVLVKKTILEIGCGTGRITKKLLEYDPMEIHCIEVSPCMMKRHSEINSVKIFRETKYFQLWEPSKKEKKFQIAICSLVLIHNREFEIVVERLCSFTTEKIFVIEDVTNPLYRKRPISQYTFLRKKEVIIHAFNKFGWQLKKSSEHTLYEDKLIFLEFNLPQEQVT